MNLTGNVKNLSRRASIFLVTGLVAVLLLLIPGSALGVTTSLSVDKSSYLLGEPVEFTGYVTFSEDETKNLNSVTLNISGIQSASQVLPAAVGSYSYPANNLDVVVSWNNIEAVAGYGGQAFGYKGLVASSSIQYDVTWDPPVFKSPAPVFSLIPNTVAEFNIPQLSAPTLAAGLPDTLPTLTDAFDIPALTEVDPNAPDPLPSLTALSNSLPLLTTATVGAPADLPSTGDLADTVASIPQSTADLISGVAEMPSSTAWLTGLGKVEGLETDGTYIYVLTDAGGSSVDTISKYDSSGDLVTAFGTSGVASVVTQLGNEVQEAEGIAYAGGALYVSHNQSTIDDETPGERYLLQFNKTTGAAATRCGWLNFNGPWDQKLESLTGNGGDLIYAQSTTSDQRMYVYDVSNNCSKQDDRQPNYSTPHALGYKSDLVYAVSEAGAITTATSGSFQDENTSVGTVTGFTSAAPGGFLIDSNGVMYIANNATAGSTDGVVKKTQPSSTISTTPKGMTYDSTNENLYVLVNGNGGTNDWLLKLTTAGVLVNSYDTGVTSGEGLAFLGGKVYVTYEDNNSNSKMKAFDPSAGTFGSEISIQTQWGNAGFEGFTSDGSTLFLYPGSANNFRTIDTNGDEDEDGACQPHNCDNLQNGATAAAYRSADSSYFLAKTKNIYVISELNGDSTQEGVSYTTLTYNSSNLKIKGMTFVGDVLYIADDGADQILKASIPTGETTSPRALTNDGTFLWAITNGIAGTDTLLKLNASTGAKITGYALARDDAEGLAYHNSALWVLYNTSSGACKVQSIDPSNGAAIGSLVSLGSQNHCDNFGGMSSDGTNLWVHKKSGDSATGYATDGTKDVEKGSSEFSSGAHAVAYRSSSGGQLWFAKGAKIDAFTQGSYSLDQVSGMAQTNLTVDNGTTSGSLSAKGMTWIGSTLYVVDDTTDTIYKTSAPAGSNSVLGMASDGTYLYALLNNSPTDSIMKLDTSGNKVTAWATSGVASTSQSGAVSITVMGSNIWVGEFSQDMGPSKWKLNAYAVTDGSANTGANFEYNNVPYGNSQPKGLSNDGTYLYLGDTAGGEVYKFDTSSGDTAGSQIQLDGMSNTGINGLVVRSTDPKIVAVQGSKLRTYGIDGSTSGYDSFTLDIGGFNGLASIGQVLYLAESANNTVKKAAIPLPTTVISKQPKGMTDDGSDIYVVVEASPRDYIMKVDTSGDLVTSFGTDGSVAGPVDDIGGIDFFDDSLYVVAMVQSSGGGSYGGNQSRGTVYELNKDTGAEVSSFQLPLPCDMGSPCYGDVSALTNDGTNLIVGTQSDSAVTFSVDPENSGSITSLHQNCCPEAMKSMDSALYANGSLYAVQNNKFVKFSVSNNNNELTAGSTDMLVGIGDVQGMAYIGTTIYLASYTGEGVKGSTLPENIPELTIVGSYTAAMEVETQESGEGGTLPSTLPGTLPSTLPGTIETVTSTAASFSFAKTGSTALVVTAPASGFSVYDANLVITGTLSDPAVDTVSVGVDLPFTSLFSDGGEDAGSAAKFTTKSGLWNIACKATVSGSKNSNGDCGWYYGNTSTMNYDTGQNAGALEIGAPISVISDDITFKFNTWWDTEPGADYDQKLVQVAVETTAGGGEYGAWTTIAAILGPYDIDMQSGQPWDVPNNLKNLPIQWKSVPQANMQAVGGGCPPYCGNQQPCPPNCGGDPYGAQSQTQGQAIFDPVVIDLSAFKQVAGGTFDGKSIKIRFYFDTTDAFVNNMEGWYIDDITIGGAGFLGTTAAVTPVTDAAVKATGVYGTFSTVFALAEGSNTVTVQALNPYNTNLTSSTAVTGFLDTTPPKITMNALTSPTNAATAAVGGNIADVNFQELTITQTTTLGTKTIVTVKTIPDDGTFSKVAGLVEGTNTFTATAKDGAGLTAAASVSITLDTVGPVLTVNTPSYPIGATSARQGEPVIFSVDASATGAIVDRVEILFPHSSGGGNSTARFKTASQIPDAIKDLWDVSGEFILASNIPDSASPGTYSLTINAYDSAGNVTTDTVVADVVASLEGYNINLMPDWNLVSLPLMPTASDMATMTAGVTGIQSVWYYDAGKTLAAGETAADKWLVYTPSTADVDTLTTLETGRGYWFKMDPTVFTLSSPLAPGLPHTPQAIKLTYTGQFVEPGTLPPSYNVVAGWNAVGFHSENELPVTTALQSLESPQRIWGSLLQYNNRIVFTIADTPGEDPTFEILLGAFQRLLSTDNMTPGYGYWIFMVDEGVITP